MIETNAQHQPYEVDDLDAAAVLGELDYAETEDRAAARRKLRLVYRFALLNPGDADSAATWGDGEPGPGSECADPIGGEGSPLVASAAVPRLGAAMGVALATALAWLADVLAYLDGSRALLAALLAEHLPEARCTPPEGTYLAWVDLRALDPPEGVADRLLADAGVAVVDGARCGEPGRGHIRLNLATPRPVLRQVVARIGDALRGGRT